MRKKILIAAVILILLAAAAGAYVVMNLNSLIAAFKPQLEKIASDIAGSPVSFGKLEAALYPSANIAISDIAVKSAAPSGERVGVKEIKLSVELMPLLSKKIKVSKATVKGLEILLVKEAGQMRIPGVKQPGERKEATSPAGPAGSDGAAQPAFDLDAFELRESSITLDDRDKNQSFGVSELYVDTSIKSDAGTFKFPSLAVSGKLLGQLPFKVRGANISFNPASGDADIEKLSAIALNTNFDLAGKYNTKSKNGALTFESPGIDLPELKTVKISDALSAKLTELNPQGRAVPKANIQLGPSGFSAKGNVILSGVGANVAAKPVNDVKGQIDFDVNSMQSKVSSSDLSLSFNGAPLTVALAATLTGSNLKIEDLKAQGFGGQTAIAGDVILGTPPRFQIRLTTGNLQIDPMMRAISPNRTSNLLGLVQKADLAVTGEAGPEMIRSLAGSVSFVVLDGALKNVNVAGDVLKNVKNLPLVGGALMMRVPEAYRNAMNSADTEIKRMSATMRIADGVLTTNDLSLLNPLFSLDGKGRIGIGGAINLSCLIRFEQQFSLALVGSIKELAMILDNEKRLSMPVAVSGTPPDISIMPDASKLLERGTKKFIEDKAGEVLQNLLQGGKSPGRKGLLGF